MNISSLSIILPTINEADNLKILIPEITNLLLEIKIDDYEIIVVDDGSKDNTKDLINNKLKNKKLKLFTRSSEPSLPMSIWDGITMSSKKYILWMDADGSMHVGALQKLLKQLDEEKDSIIIGSRFVKDGGYKGIEVPGKTSFIHALKNVYFSNDTIIATILSLIMNKIIRFILRTQIKDITSGFIAGKKEYFNNINVFSQAYYGDYFIYLITDLKNRNINQIEVGYICEARMYGESKTGSALFGIIKNGIPYIKAVLKCTINLGENKRQKQ